MITIFRKSLRLFLDLKFAIFLLFLIALISFLGTLLGENEFLLGENQNFIKLLKLDQFYSAWYFVLLLVLLTCSLLSCTLIRQFPLVQNSKKELFKKEKNSFVLVPKSGKINKKFYLKEYLLYEFNKQNFSIYQKKNMLYAYKGLVGRVSPIFVHFSLILILLSAFSSSFLTFNIQETLPKGEIFHFQTVGKIGSLAKFSGQVGRVNDFWIDYKKGKISQFYSNISLLSSDGNELKNQTISVNNPYRSNNIDFYQSDWNLNGLRVYELGSENRIREYPLFPFSTQKLWITWLNSYGKNYTLIVDGLENKVWIYNQFGEYLSQESLEKKIFNNQFIILEILSSTSLLIKSDPTIIFVYLGFGGLIITTFLSYLPYNQIWIFNNFKYIWIGLNSNRETLNQKYFFEKL
jgi:cytochrome c biogenesis protein